MILIGAALGMALAAQSTQVVVTVLGKHDGPAPRVTQPQVDVKQGGRHDAITGWAKYGDQDRLDLVLAFDDDSHNMGQRMADIHTFLQALPANVAVALVYFHTGIADIAQPFNLDHARVDQAMRPPTGIDGSSPSPFGSLSNLLGRWPRHPGQRRELIMISDGEEHVGGNNGTNLTFERAIQDAVASGVVVYTIYAGAATTGTAAADEATIGEVGAPIGHAGMAALSNVGNAQSNSANGIANLSELASVTGGQSYAEGMSTPTRFKPCLDDIAARMRDQYALAFTPSDGHGLTGIHVEIKDLSNASVTAPRQIFVGGH